MYVYILPFAVGVVVGYLSKFTKKVEIPEYKHYEEINKLLYNEQVPLFIKVPVGTRSHYIKLIPKLKEYTMEILTDEYGYDLNETRFN